MYKRQQCSSGDRSDEPMSASGSEEGYDGSDSSNEMPSSGSVNTLRHSNKYVICEGSEEESSEIADFSSEEDERLDTTKPGVASPKRCMVVSVGVDIMAHVLSFLEPPEVLSVLAMPLSRSWSTNFSESPELWRVLCRAEPFKATLVDHEASDLGEEGRSVEVGFRHRRLYSSFVLSLIHI